ncbi:MULTISPECIES: enolase C-terminal domain-like protein [Bradyrhizobium]|uniref:enolase C-terminal domain-like protein n=1 Tax=Bradyrhizobium TaxID=374 RepID=UPI0011442C61|nr:MULTISPECIES: enolase C-terminal domain-like protein [Bradyrhizobium]MCC8969628.1 mandelate racemase [Bradyrhizobium brasilense]NLS74208.1 mandelate racemase [Bradyrhizobium brasilense]
MSKICKVEIIDFVFDVRNLQRTGFGLHVGFKRGATLQVVKNAIAIETKDGLRGEYVTNWCASPATRGEMEMLAPFLLGRDALQREALFDDLKREIRQWSGMGHGPLDICLWDLAGKKYGVSVSELIGGYRHRLPVYASTYLGDAEGGLDCKEAYAAFAEQCYALGFRAYKIHGWNDGDARREAENVLHVAKVVGDHMVLMLDPANQLRTFSDALYVGRACDEASYFWYEDPFRDNGKSAFVHRKLREMLTTPLLLTEYVRGIEPKADFIVAGGTDFLRVDPEYDHGITGALRVARLGEAFGLDVEIHACGPAHRHLMSAMRNSNYYELALVGPECPNVIAPVFTCGYSDQLDCVGQDGCVPVPTGPGLGVSYDWDFIRKNAVANRVFA